MPLQAHEGFSDDATPEQAAEIVALTKKFTDVIDTDRPNPQIILGAVGLLVRLSFENLGKRHSRVRLFEDFAYHIRKQIIEDLRRQES